MSWRALLRDFATIKRSTTTTSDSGADSQDWDTTIATGVPCSIQDSGGRMRQAEFGQRGERMARLVFGPEVDLIQNDLVIRARDGMPYKVVHLHMAAGGHHLMGVGQQWSLSGKD